MSSTILTVIVLVVMWIVVLVPMFTRQRDDASESTVERFSSAMRTLGRRPETTADVTETDEDIEENLEEDVVEDEEFEQDEPVVRPMPAARAQMLARRRRTLGTLVSLTLITVLLALGWRSQLWLLNGVFDVLLVGYLWWLRQEARREQQRRARRAARGEPVAHTERPRRRPAPARSPMSAPAPEAEEQVEVDDGRWEPRPVPTPTYVTAPMAPRASYVRDEPLQGPIGLDEQDATLSEDFEDDYPTMEIIIPPRAVGE